MTGFWNSFAREHGGKIVGLFLVVSTLLIYWQVEQFDFLNYDDGAYVTDNGYVRDGLTVQGLVWAFTEFHESNWHPVTWLSHMLDVQLFGLDPGAHHLVNLLFHIVNALLLFHILRQMTGTLWRSAVVATLFALHPLHVESVAWIAERKDVLSALFWLLSTFFYYQYVKKPSSLAYFLVFATMALGLMSKPMVVTLPFVLLLLDFWPLARPESRLLQSRINAHSIRAAWPLVREKIPLFALSAFSCLMTFYVQNRGGAVASMEFLDMGGRIANATISYWMYILKMLLPVDLAVYYPYPDSMPLLKSSIAALVLVGISYVAFRARKKYPYLTVGWFCYLGTLVPVIGLVQVGSQAMADRYTYIPLIGLFIIVAWGAADMVAKFPGSRVWVMLVTAILLPLVMAVTAVQIGYWRDSAALFEHALAVTPDNALARNNLGQALAQKGQTSAAIEHFQKALQFKADQGVVQVNLGNALVEQGQIEKAISHYRVALRTRQTADIAHNRMGLAFEKMGNNDQAVYHYQQALRLNPEFGEAQYNLGTLYFNAGAFENAINPYREVLRLNPLSVETLNSLGLAYEKSGSRDWAIKHYRQALKIDPDFARAHGNLGVAYFRDGQLEQAIEHLERAVELDPDYELAKQNLVKATEKLKEK